MFCRSFLLGETLHKIFCYFLLSAIGLQALKRDIHIVSWIICCFWPVFPCTLLLVLNWKKIPTSGYTLHYRFFLFLSFCFFFALVFLSRGKILPTHCFLHKYVQLENVELIYFVFVQALLFPSNFKGILRNKKEKAVRLQFVCAYPVAFRFDSIQNYTNPCMPVVVQCLFKLSIYWGGC